MLLEALAKKSIKKTKEWFDYADVPNFDHLVDMINSEFEELLYAIRQEDKVEEFDAVIDIIYLALQLYVHSGGSGNTTSDVENALMSIIKFNNHGVVDYSEQDLLLGLEAVHASNMSKFCKTEEEAIETVDRYAVGDRVVTCEKVNDLYVVKDDHGKVRKGVNYKPPTDDFRKILIDAGVMR